MSRSAILDNFPRISRQETTHSRVPKKKRPRKNRRRKRLRVRESHQVLPFFFSIQTMFRPIRTLASFSQDGTTTRDKGHLHETTVGKRKHISRGSSQSEWLFMGTQKAVQRHSCQKYLNKYPQVRMYLKFWYPTNSLERSFGNDIFMVALRIVYLLTERKKRCPVL